MYFLVCVKDVERKPHKSQKPIHEEAKTVRWCIVQISQTCKTHFLRMLVSHSVHGKPLFHLFSQVTFVFLLNSVHVNNFFNKEITHFQNSIFCFETDSAEHATTQQNWLQLTPKVQCSTCMYIAMHLCMSWPSITNIVGLFTSYYTSHNNFSFW